uniref:Uncharacterized protein n=1 Tax=Chenopodium quinoa TaxID=63459 RepID=A0A803LJW4_CHEQI
MEAAKAKTEAAFKPAHLVTFSPTPSSKLNNRRLSSQFSKPSSPIRAGATKKKTLAWISLQGRLVGADEATSAQAIDGGLSQEEAVGWELFSRIHRVLIVAVAAAKCEKNRQIFQLRKCVQLRGNSLVKAASGDEMFKNRLSISNEAEQEECRMSDLSDWASSVTSVADLLVMK